MNEFRNCSESSRNRRVYGVDLDGVVFNFVTPFSAYLKRNLNINYDDKDIVDYHWYNCIPGLEKAKFYKMFYDFCANGDFQDLKPLPGAKVAVDTLLDCGQVYFITSRPEITRFDSLVSLKRYFKIKDDQLIIAEKSKVDDVIRLRVTHFIDDAPRNVEEVATHTGANVYLMDQPYNKEVKHPGVIRISSWLEMLERVS